MQYVVRTTLARKGVWLLRNMQNMMKATLKQNLMKNMNNLKSQGKMQLQHRRKKLKARSEAAAAAAAAEDLAEYAEAAWAIDSERISPWQR